MSDAPGGSPTESLRPDSDPRDVAIRYRGGIDATTVAPTSIGPYRILRVLGEGGMGTVYLAEQEKPIHRKVALKIIKLGMDTKAVIARFEAEREALALMNHPNVAKVFDAGATEQGRPYFAMEYVEGVALTQFCDDKRLTLTQRLELFMQVCQAVQHAHQKGIIHRDLKPSNVLVSQVDGQPSVKVIDFGIAKATQQKLTEQTFATEQGILVGTPAYMSPEQADPSCQDIDTRTDIYSLGVILYELLVGALPFDPDTLRKAALSEIQRMIREVDPPKPSSRVWSAPRTPSRYEPQAPARGSSSAAANEEPLPHGRGSDSHGRGSDSRSRDSNVATVASQRGTDPKSLHRQIRGDLDWIVMKCLEKDRARRYDTANALLMELRRFLNNEPVTAGPPSATYRLRKFVRRNRGSVSAVAAVVVVLAGGMITSTLMYFRAEKERLRAELGETQAEESRAQAIKERNAAELSKRESQAVTAFLTNMFSSVDPANSSGRDVRVSEILGIAAKKLRTGISEGPLVEATLRLTIGRTYAALGRHEEAEPHLLRGLELRRKHLGPSHLDVAECLTDLSVLKQAKGDYEAAEGLTEEALLIRRSTLPADDTLVFQSRYNLAVFAFQMGNFAKAHAVAEETLTRRRQVLGPAEDTLLSDLLDLLSHIALEKGDCAGARAQAEEAVAMNRRLYGNEHVYVAQRLDSLGWAHIACQQWTEAESAFQEAVSIHEKVYPSGHPDTARALCGLGQARLHGSSPESAGAAIRRGSEMQQNLLDKSNADRLFCLSAFGELLIAEGDVAAAAEQFRTALRIHEQRPRDSWNVGEIKSLLGECLLRMGQTSEAESYLLGAYQSLRAIWGEDHARTRKVRDLLSALPGATERMPD